MFTRQTPWYVAGLHFECTKCGRCCSGPAEGYIWICKVEIEMLAADMDMTVEQLRRRHMKRIGTRTSIIEDRTSKDCIFLKDMPDGERGCEIYQRRPNQCRTWPFWNINLLSSEEWNTAGQKCPGINRGRLYTFEEIERIRNQKNWWAEGCGGGTRGDR